MGLGFSKTLKQFLVVASALSAEQELIKPQILHFNGK